jgi:ribosomal protein S25
VYERDARTSWGDLYNDNQIEKIVRKLAERLEIGTSVVRRVLQELTKGT